MASRRDPHDAPAVRAFATELTAWREAARKSKVELAELLGYTPQWVGQIEGLKSIPSEKFAEDLDTYFTTNGLFHRLWKLITETRFLAVLPPGFPEYVEREAEAATLHIFNPLVIHGLLQSHDYAHALLKPGRSLDETEALVSTRMERQKILTRQAPSRIVAIFDEWAIRRVIGGREVMCDQYRHLIELARLYNVTVQIVPSTAGAYAGLPGAFTILGFDDGPDLVYTEGHVNGTLTDHRAFVQEHRLSYDLIRSAAMSAGDSLKLLSAALEGT